MKFDSVKTQLRYNFKSYFVNNFAMLDPRELRIGNILSTKLNESGWVAIDFNHLKHVMVDGNAYEYKSLPLTEEWLLKFGFEKDDDLFSKDCYHYRISSGYFYSGNDHISGGNPDAQIKYVHQLQNLIFALTGEELTIK